MSKKTAQPRYQPEYQQKPGTLKCNNFHHLGETVGAFDLKLFLTTFVSKEFKILTYATCHVNVNAKLEKLTTVVSR